MGILTETLVHENMTSCTDLSCCNVVDEIATSCKAICGVASVRTSDYSQPFWLK